MRALRSCAIVLALTPAAAGQSLLDTFDGPAAGAELGRLVADAGDVDGDGVGDLLVGAPDHTPVGGPAEAGSLYVISGADGTQLHHWTGTTAQGHYGLLAAGAGDVDADGRDDVVVRVPGQYELQVLSGASGLPILSCFPVNPDDKNPSSIDGAGDWNADGHDDLIAGYANSGWGTGAYHYNRVGIFEVYSGADGSLLDFATGPMWENYNLGQHVRGLGDVDGNGHDDVLVVANFNDDLGVFVYSAPIGTVLYQVDTQDPGNLSLFGTDVAAAGDVDGDGRPDFLVGAPAYKDPTLNDWVGAVHLFSGVDGSLIHTVPGSTPWAWFGSWVAGGRDLDLDGVPDFAAGSSSLGWVRIFSGADASTLRTHDQAQLGEPPSGAFDLVDDRDQNLAGEVAFGLPTASPAGLDSGRVSLYAGCDGRWEIFGAGLAGSGGTAPTLAGAGCPLPGETVELRVADGLGGAPGALLYGLAPTALPIFGGHLLVGFPEFWFHGLGGLPGAAGQGAVAIPVPLPPKPSLSGKVLFLQAWYLDLGAVQSISMTAGLKLVIG